MRAGGFHVYDGHQHQKSRDERRAAVNAEWEKVVAFRDEIEEFGRDHDRRRCIDRRTWLHWHCDAAGE